MSDEMSDYIMKDSLPADSVQKGTGYLSDLMNAGSHDNALTQNALNFNFSVEEQSSMMRTIEEIFLLEEELPKEDQQMGDDDEEEPEIDLEDQQRRTTKLKGVLSTLAQLWWSDSEQMDVAAEKLADGSRDRKSKRVLELYYTAYFIPFLLIVSGFCTMESTLFNLEMPFYIVLSSSLY
jgi:hypothetical protein